jgi:FAD/FMN-containing dehydrogenase
MNTMLDAAFPAGMQNYWKSGFVADLDDGAIDVLVDRAARMTSPRSALLIEYYGGAAGRVAEDATAFPHRRAEYDVVITAQWADPVESDQHIAWARDTWEAVRPFGSGRVYVNVLGVEGDERVREAYGANYDRLARTKAQYDPDNVFRVNQNIAPAA